MMAWQKQDISITRALDKREYLMVIFSYFSSKPYDVTPHLYRLIEAVQMRGHNISFYIELKKLPLIITK